MRTPISPIFSNDKDKVFTCICEGCGVELEYMFTGTKYDANGVQLIDHPLEDGLCYHCIYGYEDDLTCM